MRIASVIFVRDYAFMILAFALLGLGSGGVLSYYRFKSKENPLLTLDKQERIILWLYGVTGLMSFLGFA